MISSPDRDVRVYPDTESLSHAAARSLVDRITAAIQENRRVSIALAGGNTLRALYGVLASRYRDRILWGWVHVFWGDECYVSRDDLRSNYRMAREMLLDTVPVPAENVHPIPTGLADPEKAAVTYERTLRRHFALPWPRFDFVLLGMDADGHIASLFPGSPAVEEQQRWVVAVRVPAEPRQRLTLTLPVLNLAEHIDVLVAGGEKAEALARVLTGGVDPREVPAAGVRPAHGAMIWWADEGAAGLLDPPVRSRSPYPAGEMAGGIC